MRKLKLTQWYTYNRNLVKKHDYDNVMLFEGDEGVGKSNAAFQMCSHLDPTFNHTRVVFDVQSFLDLAPTLEPGQAIQLDEVNLLARNAMSKDTRQLLQFLKDCRALNLHIAICFPQSDLFDGAIRDYRIRWFVEQPSRGHVIIKKRVKMRGPNDSLVIRRDEVVNAKIGQNQGSEWQAYETAKDRHMKSYGVKATEKEEWTAGLEDELTGLWHEYEEAGQHKHMDNVNLALLGWSHLRL